MRVRYLMIYLLCSFFLFSCFEKKVKIKYTFNTLKDFETDFNFKYVESIPNEISRSLLDSGLRIYLQDLKNREIGIFTLDKDTLFKRANENLNLTEYYFETFLKTDDSIYQLKIGTAYIILRNRKGEILNTFNLDQSFYPIIYPPADLKYKNNCFIMGTASSSIGIGLKKDRLIYYRTVKPIIVAKIIDTTLHCIVISDFPKKYINTGNSYNDHLPSACIGKNNSICVSFGADDNLSLYHDSTLLLRKAVKSIYIDKFNPYPDEKLLDMLYLKNYGSEEPRYINIIYDQFENVYYRIVKHRHNNSEANSIGKTWSVMVIDTDLNVLGEMKFNGDYKYGIFIPTPIGIITAKRNRKNPDKATLSLIKINRNEN